MSEAEKRTVTIMPATALTHEMFNVCKRALESHKATTQAHLICLDNQDADPGLQQELQKLVESLGYEYDFSREDFSLTKFWNRGYEMAEGRFEYVVLSNADVLFHNFWLHYLLEAWAQNDNASKYLSMHPYTYSAVHPYTYSAVNRGVNYRSTTVPLHETRLVEQPQMHCSLFRTKDQFRFDEQFERYECDCDYWYWMRFNNLQAGINYASRVDHQIQGLVKQFNKASMDKIADSDRMKFFNKWEPVLVSK